MSISTIFGNPAVKILEGHLWEAARKRYLGEHPRDQQEDATAVMRKVQVVYKDEVAERLKEADHQLRAKWSEFKHGMEDQLRTALATVFRMSYVQWYAVEVGQLPYPEVIAVPYELLKHITAEVLPQFLRKNIDFEDLDDATLEALASFAVDEKFEEVVQRARRSYEPFEIGDRLTWFVVAELIKGDAYFLGDEQHHSKIDMVILIRTNGDASDKGNEKTAVKKWWDRDRKNRKNDRRFSGDGWDIEFEELKTFALEP